MSSQIEKRTETESVLLRIGPPLIAGMLAMGLASWPIEAIRDRNVIELEECKDSYTPTTPLGAPNYQDATDPAIIRAFTKAEFGSELLSEDDHDLGMRDIICFDAQSGRTGLTRKGNAISLLIKGLKP